MDRHENIISLIESIRESFGASIAVYTMGSCYQFSCILKKVFLDGESYYDGNHVWTKINSRFYDIRGEKIFDREIRLVLVESDPSLVKALSGNRYTDERRRLMFEEKRNFSNY